MEKLWERGIRCGGEWKAATSLPRLYLLALNSSFRACKGGTSIMNEPSKTLTDFIDQNQKLFSIVGIFTALSVFINQLPGELARSDQGLHFVLRSISCLLCILATITYIQIFKNSAQYPQIGLVWLFNDVLFLVFAMFVYVWFKTFAFGIAGAALVFALVIFFFIFLALIVFFVKTYRPYFTEM